MKIIKEGLKRTQKKPYTLTFHCYACGCEFKLEEGDGFVAEEDDSWQSRGEVYYRVTCPNKECRQTVTAT